MNKLPDPATDKELARHNLQTWVQKYWGQTQQNLTQTQATTLMQCTYAERAFLQDSPAKPTDIEQLEKDCMQNLPFAIMTQRMVSVGLKTSVFFRIYAATLARSPGEAVMMSVALRWKFPNKSKDDFLTLEEFCYQGFSTGYPDRDSMGVVWEQQKVDSKPMRPDNLVDYAHEMLEPIPA